jgi:hypothetical protein
MTCQEALWGFRLFLGCLRAIRVPLAQQVAPQVLLVVAQLDWLVPCPPPSWFLTMWLHQGHQTSWFARIDPLSMVWQEQQ